jgi:hypothetical protein
VLFDLNNVPMLEPEEALEDHEEGIGLANLLPHNDAGLQLDPNMDLDLMLLQSLQETAKSTRVQITYESPLVSYVIYEGQCKRS